MSDEVKKEAPAPDGGAVWRAHHGDTPLQGAAREAGWALSSLIDSAPWERRRQLQGIVERLGVAIDRLVWPWPGDDVRHDEIRDAWRAYADGRTDDNGKIDVTEIETCVAIGCMKTIQLLSSSSPDTLAERVCKICDGGPGNEGPCLCGMKAWDILAESADAILALRARPPAREDAQPVAWRLRPNDGLTYDWAIVQSDPNKTAKVRAGLYDVQPLYTHPAPDALREKLEAAFTGVRTYSGVTIKRIDVQELVSRALAVLQVEQKGGA